MPCIHVDVRPAQQSELIFIERAFPFGPAEKHVERLQRQKRGDVLYLVAWYEGMPVGHGLLKWLGADEEHIAARFTGQCPDVEDLYVLESMRSKCIGRQILHTAERLVLQRGYTQIGLSVDVRNPRAKVLYILLGYRDSQLGEHYERGEYVDQLGQLQMWEERCIYLIKSLQT